MKILKYNSAVIIIFLALVLASSIFITTAKADLNSDPSLIGWWKFDDGTGTSASDSSSAQPPNNATLVNGPTWTNGLNGTSVMGGALEFNGTNNYVDASSAAVSLQGASVFTVSVWAYALSNNGNNTVIAIKSGDEGHSLFLLLPYLSNGTTVYWNSNLIQGNVIQTGQWHLFTFISNSATDHELYIDGQLKGSSGNSEAFTSDLSTIYFGTWRGTSDGNTGYFNGYIDDARIYTRALSSAEVLELYTDGVTKETQAPTWPVNPSPVISVTTIGTTSVSLQWPAAVDLRAVTGYNIYRNGTLINTTVTPSYSDTGLAPGVSYSYTVSAFNAANLISVQLPVFSVTTLLPDTSPPTIPANLQMNFVYSTQATISWTASSDPTIPGQVAGGVVGYDVYRCTGAPNCSNPVTMTTTSTTFTDAGLIANTTYYYTVSAYDAVPNTSAQSFPLTVVTNNTTAPVLNSDRMLDWAHSGVVQSINGGIDNGPRGIPTNMPDCQLPVPITTDNPGAIQQDINQCPDHTVINIPAGSYNISGYLTVNHPVVLRGAGTQSTILVPVGEILFQEYPYGSYPDEQYPITIVNWTGGLSKGSTLLTMDSTTGLRVGQTIVVDQLNDPSVVSLYGNGANNTTGLTNGLQYGRSSTTTYPQGNEGTQRVQMQVNQITQIINGTQIMVDSPIYFTHQSALSPTVWWIDPRNYINYAGIENLSVDGINKADTSTFLIDFETCSNCWAKDINVFDTNARAPIRTGSYSYRDEVRDSYFTATTPESGSTRYAGEFDFTSGTLVENNIFYNVNCLDIDYTSSGLVFAYNYIDPNNGPFMSAGIEPHISHSYSNLMEGNVTTQIDDDNIWGSGSGDTIFRNRLWGNDISSDNNNRIAIKLDAQHHNVNILGNVLGSTNLLWNGQNITESYQYSYNNQPVGTYNSTINQDGGIYSLGFWNSNQVWNPLFTPAYYDPNVLVTLLRWGNYDTANGSVQWNQGEVPSDVYAGIGAPSKILPNSLYLSSQPFWWGNRPWPAIGPDVTGGDATVAGHSYNIPAQDCFVKYNLATNPSAFNPAFCYETATGDVSGNGTVTMYDAALALRDLSAGGACTTLTLQQCASAQVDGLWNDQIDSEDVLDIAKKALGL